LRIKIYHPKFFLWAVRCAQDKFLATFSARSHTIGPSRWT